MKVEVIGPFAEQAAMVLEKELGAKPRRGDLSLKPSPFPASDLNVIIGVTGDIEGQVVYSMSLSTAQWIASTMMGMEADISDEIARSAINELGNMVTGRAMTALSRNGYSAIITPPSLFVGKDMIVTTVMPILGIPLLFDDGRIDINVALREKK